MAVVAAGGEVKANPRGREMGLGRKIRLTAKGLKHPFMAGKPPVYSGFISHVDEVIRLPRGTDLLATNDFTHVQAVAVKHKKGEFWGLQYHPEYDLHELARLIVAREPKLVPEGFFTGHDDLTAYVARLEELHANPGRKDLRWQLDIDDDVLSARVRQTEVANWVNRLVLRPRRK
jgi:GMP synthase (glutamine-hydrolysing)